MTDRAARRRPEQYATQPGAQPGEEVEREIAPAKAQPRDTDLPPSATSRTRPTWAVVQRFVHDGFHYQIRRRPLTVADSYPRLTPREVQVLELIQGGSTNKEVAYSLGLAQSTVGVLVYRAAAKLGVKSRRELVSTYDKWKVAGNPPDE